MRSSVHGLTIWLFAACGLTLARPLAAQDSAAAVAAGNRAEPNDDASLRTAERSAAAGVFLRLAESPTTSTHRAYVSTHGGYDGRRQGALFDTRGEVVLMSRSGLAQRSRVGLALLGGGTYVTGNPGFSELSSARAGLKLQPIFEAQHGFDAAVSVTYESRGFNLVPAVSTDLLLARHIGDTQLLFNVGYSAGVRASERSGRLRVAVLTPLGPQLRIGLEARGTLDLERDHDEPAGETDYEFAAGAVANYTISHVSLMAGAGPGAIRYRNGTETSVGVIATLGLGATL